MTEHLLLGETSSSGLEAVTNESKKEGSGKHYAIINYSFGKHYVNNYTFSIFTLLKPGLTIDFPEDCIL